MTRSSAAGIRDIGTMKMRPTTAVELAFVRVSANAQDANPVATSNASARSMGTGVALMARAIVNGEAGAPLSRVPYDA